MNKEILARTEDILTEVQDAFFDIPFDNSAYQTKMFVIQSQQTPARAYRAIGLQMMSKIQAIKDMKYARELEDVNVEEWQDMIANADISEYEKRRLNIKIRQVMDGRAHSDKLLNDAIFDLDTLYSELKKFPKYTREAFESEEEMHFTLRLSSQLKAGGNGAMTSLEAMQNETVFEQLRRESHDNKLLHQG